MFFSCLPLPARPMRSWIQAIGCGSRVNTSACGCRHWHDTMYIYLKTDHHIITAGKVVSNIFRFMEAVYIYKEFGCVDQPPVPAIYMSE